MTILPTSAIEKPKVYESKHICLSSPILHIGSEVSQLNPFEFIVTRDRVYIPNNDLLAKELLKRARLQDYLKAIEKRESIGNLLKQVFGDTWWQVKSEDRLIFPKNKTSQKWTDKPIANLRPMIRNGFGVLYIPGSSIKGAMRTAIAYHLLKYQDKYNVPQQQRVSEIEKKLRLRLDNGELQRKPKFTSQSLFMDSLFTNFNLVYQGQLVSAKENSPNTDFMRAIHIADSNPLNTYTLKNSQGKNIAYNNSIVAEVIVSSHTEDWKAKYKSSLFVEMAHRVMTDFTITLDIEMLNWFQHRQGMRIPFKNIDELLNICKEFAQDQWNFEAKNYWEQIGNNQEQKNPLNFDTLWDKYYAKPECPYHLRLGWGSGMNGTTMGLLLNDDLRAEIRDTCGIKAPGFEAPKSRRTIRDTNGEIAFVPGWVKLQEM